MNTNQIYKEHDKNKDCNVNAKLEQWIRKEVLGQFEEVIRAAMDKAILHAIPCSNRKDDYERVKAIFIERYLEPLIQYKFKEDCDEQE